ncbi:NDP-hexose 2,3-dehydratase family protein [Spiractinospora alimapuensis]|uniref:NDP-hexose 2,3-dehydratase family protein n=1 Tax=Spiractinospora alimapuensis TaxID=2820884 RepID=UPI001F3AE0FF|nr:NDP-hexose 2,3-dehydratase family protein [Spiractinospora alimapuensis]QVQ51819.1 NDP-hexose 2,3-dehydratase family protein [Spiractinospora alimapuensis]
MPGGPPSGPAGTGHRSLPSREFDTVERLTRSAEEPLVDGAEWSWFRAWWNERRRDDRMLARPVAFDALSTWGFDRESGDLAHDSGRYFTVTGLRVRRHGVTVRDQPILHQPETGILGFLVQERAGVLRVLVQAKAEPGNIDGPQLSPTVQATASNQARVHGGSSPPYLEYFTDPPRDAVLADSLQSEQGIWFWQKQNRNMVVEVTSSVPEHESFRWIPLARLRRLVAADHLVNMDARSILGCLPFAPAPLAGPDTRLPDNGFRAALRRSYTSLPADTDRTGGHGELRRWLTALRAATPWSARPIPLRQIDGWERSALEIVDGARRDFRITAARVHTASREVAAWGQPLLAPRGQGHCVLVVMIVEGVLRLLVRAAPEPGLRHVVEVAPSIRVPGGVDPCDHEPSAEVLAAAGASGASRTRLDTVLSEEGGRFLHADTRYQVVEVDPGSRPSDVDALPPSYRWVTVGELLTLAELGHQLTIETRTMLACLHSLW